MVNVIDPIIDTVDGFLAWVSSSLGQASETYCQLESAENEHTLVAKDGSLVSILRFDGATYLVGPEEFEKIHGDLTRSLQSILSRDGHAIQVYFMQDQAAVRENLEDILAPAKQTAEKLNLSLDDLFSERIDNLEQYCASERSYFVLWTRPTVMSDVQSKVATKNKAKQLKANKVPPLRNAQNILAAIPEMYDAHTAFVKVINADLESLGIACQLLNVHESCHAIRMTIDPEFTDKKWKPSLPGDKLPIRQTKHHRGDISDLLWPPLSQQLIPRDGENLDLRTTRIGDRIYGSVFIDLFPKEVEPFIILFNRLLNTGMPWRISFMIESNGMNNVGMRPILASFLSFASNNNKLINGAMSVLNELKDNSDEAIVKLKVSAATWTKVGEEDLLKIRVAELAKAIQGWGYTETSEVTGDPFGGVLSSALGLSTENYAIPSIAPLTDVVAMLPINRPASPWETGAVLFRSPDGKPWPYQPGSTKQTTWIDIIYARPGSGKSVLSNSINLALVLSGGLQRLPRIAIVDIGPSSSGLISLIKEALPEKQRHLVAYHRLQMRKEMSINPFDTQLGCRHPSPQDRAFLVNFLTLLATPVGETKPYDGISDMAGLIVNEMYGQLQDDASPHRYTEHLEPEVDSKLQELGTNVDAQTTWWEITDLLFKNDLIFLAIKAQRYAMPLLADAASICRNKNIEDLYGAIKAPTGESVINAFGRMISSAVREYPILSQVTAFDLGDARIVSLDLDEVAKTGGEAADRQTAIMYMLARYILARHYYLTEDAITDMPDLYKDYHTQRIREIREDPKRLVFDEFHRTSKAQSVRDQVLVDMREGRKWKVQVALLSQSIDDFDPVMVEFATAIFIMDAGPKQAIEKSCKIFGLSDTAKLALTTSVHGPRAEGATFLAQFSTKTGSNTQLITSTIGPIELWAFNTTAEDARIRNSLYDRIGPSKARLLLAKLYPSGSAAKVVEERLGRIKQDDGLIKAEENNNVIDVLIEEILDKYKKDPDLVK